MSDSKTPTRIAKILLGATPLEIGAVKPAEAAKRICSRHARITNNLNDWRSYKEWVEKTRGTWDAKK